jgi:hypothetical protein
MNLKNGGFFKETSVSGCRSKSYLESKDTALTQGDKCSKFSRPQIDLKTS